VQRASPCANRKCETKFGREEACCLQKNERTSLKGKKHFKGQEALRRILLFPVGVSNDRHSSTGSVPRFAVGLGSRFDHHRGKLKILEVGTVAMNATLLSLTVRHTRNQGRRLCTCGYPARG
jgi:hypothetical protein